ncbi:predicted protein [Uncinocarpus reesii 1704]|uniref:Uncharacterized protein n=1 Tax=Uncinocarpus reesii (strain UAMH 1704) TaxID=336963 RepID=C4JR76_UNCRE|nr:uncharacterized protein UREG_03558 [Uncinocarpus reesii 1704]EEP78712.1 predicted protein [Uncinocarpus reesii 1704]
MPCSDYLPNHPHPGSHLDNEGSKKQQIPLPAAWSKNLRSPSSHISLRMSSKSAPRDSKNPKKNLTGVQKVEIVKSIWQVNMPFLHSNAPVDMAMEHFDKNDYQKKPGSRLEPPRIDTQFDQRGSHTKSLYGAPMRSASRRETPTTESGFFYEDQSTGSRRHQPSRSRTTHGPAPSYHPGKWPKGTVSKNNAADPQMLKTNIAAISPDSTSNERMWPLLPESGSVCLSPLAGSASIITPLSASSTQPLYFVPSNLHRSPVQDRPQNSPFHSSPGLGSGTSTSEFSAGVTPNLNGSRSSSSSLEWFPDAVSPVHATNEASPVRGYDLISPISAGVFDESPRLRRNPTFRKQRSMRESRMKLLPPAPDMPVAPVIDLARNGCQSH